MHHPPLNPIYKKRKQNQSSQDKHAAIPTELSEKVDRWHRHRLAMFCHHHHHHRGRKRNSLFF